MKSFVVSCKLSDRTFGIIVLLAFLLFLAHKPVFELIEDLVRMHYQSAPALVPKRIPVSSGAECVSYASATK